LTFTYITGQYLGTIKFTRITTSTDLLSNFNMIIGNAAGLQNSCPCKWHFLFSGINNFNHSLFHNPERLQMH